MRVFGFRLPFFVAAVWVSIGSTVWALSQRGQPGRDGVYLQPHCPHVVCGFQLMGATGRLRGTPVLFHGIPGGPDRCGATVVCHHGLCPARALWPPLAGGAAALCELRHLATSYYVPTSYYRTTSYIPTVSTNSVVWPSEYVGSADCVCPGLVASAASPARESAVERDRTPHRRRIADHREQAGRGAGDGLECRACPRGHR